MARMDGSVQRRRFSEEFKLEAIRLAGQGDRLVKDVAADLGIAVSLLHRWKKEFRNRSASGLPGGGKVTTRIPSGSIFPGHGRLTPQDEEIRQLKRELAVVTQERDILKKATVYFAKESR